MIRAFKINLIIFLLLSSCINAKGTILEKFREFSYQNLIKPKKRTTEHPISISAKQIEKDLRDLKRARGEIAKMKKEVRKAYEKLTKIKKKLISSFEKFKRIRKILKEKRGRLVLIQHKMAFIRSKIVRYELRAKRVERLVAQMKEQLRHNKVVLKRLLEGFGRVYRSLYQYVQKNRRGYRRWVQELKNTIITYRRDILLFARDTIKVNRHLLEKLKKSKVRKNVMQRLWNKNLSKVKLSRELEGNHEKEVGHIRSFASKGWKDVFELKDHFRKKVKTQVNVLNTASSGTHQESWARKIAISSIRLSDEAFNQGKMMAALLYRKISNIAIKIYVRKNRFNTRRSMAFKGIVGFNPISGENLVPSKVQKTSKIFCSSFFSFLEFGVYPVKSILVNDCSDSMKKLSVLVKAKQSTY